MGSYWPSAADTSLRTLAGQTPQEFTPTEFAQRIAGKDLFVITSQGELDNHPQLRDYLAANYPVFSKGPYYLIYNLKP